MLPDFLSLKREIATRLARYARRSAEEEPLLRDVPSFQQHEGNRNDIAREDGSTGTIVFDNPLSATATIRVEDARRLGPAASVRAIREVGEQLAEGMHARLFETIKEAVEGVGNVVDAGGQPFSVDLFAEMLEKMELSFDDDGKWLPPTIVLHPDTLAKIRVRLEALDRDPVVKSRIDAIVDRKREGWRAREARRTLVD